MTALNKLERDVAEIVRSLPALLRGPIVLENRRSSGSKQKKGQPHVEDAILEKRFNEEFQKKFAAIIEHYGLSLEDNDVGMKLAMGLMFDFVPGFQVVRENKRGRTVQWTDEKLATLFCVVELKKLNGGARSNKGALRKLCRQKPWEDLLIKEAQGDKGLDTDVLLKTLENQYYRSRSLPFVETFLLQKSRIDQFLKDEVTNKQEWAAMLSTMLLASLNVLLPRAFSRARDKKAVDVMIELPK